MYTNNGLLTSCVEEKKITITYKLLQSREKNIKEKEATHLMCTRFHFTTDKSKL